MRNTLGATRGIEAVSDGRRVRLAALLAAVLTLVFPAAAYANMGIPTMYLLGVGGVDLLACAAFTALASTLAILGLRRLARDNAISPATGAAVPARADGDPVE